MCTCIKLKKNNTYFGRTLDLDFHYNESATITPRNYTFRCKNRPSFTNKYALIGTAIIFDSYPLYYEASNEKGLAMAGLNFPKNAVYKKEENGKVNLTPFELIPYLLGNFASIKEVRPVLAKLNIIDTQFKSDMPLSPLHWMIADKNETLIIEQSDKGLELFENPINVMTNNPPFLDMLKQYESQKDLTNKFVLANEAKFHCVGLGNDALKGSYSSIDRFNKAAFLVKYVDLGENDEENVAHFFHILDSVSMVKGTVLNPSDKPDITFYSSCIDLYNLVYYFKTYNNNQINALKLDTNSMRGKKLVFFPLSDKQNINYLN